MVRGFGDDRPFVDMSVWASSEALAAFVHTGRHGELTARRRRTDDTWLCPT